MSTLRQRMIDAMVLRGFAARTQSSYLACVCGLAKHYGRSPDTLGPDAIQAYLLHLISERKLAYASQSGRLRYPLPVWRCSRTAGGCVSVQ